jgi:hypothetical protein
MPNGRDRAGAVITAILIIFGTIAGCGHPGVKPRTWALSVCTSLTPWRSKIAELTAQAQRQIDTTKTPAQTKQSLVALLTGLQTASQSAHEQVKHAGVPAVDGGDAIARRFLDTLQRAGDAYGHALQSVEALDTKNSKAFYDQVYAVFGTLNEEYAASGFDPTKVNSAELQKAFAEVEECR